MDTHWSILHTLHTHRNIYLIKITSAKCGKRTSRLGEHLIGCDTMILLVRMYQLQQGIEPVIYQISKLVHLQQ